jgi:hypothetical protein
MQGAPGTLSLHSFEDTQKLSGKLLAGIRWALDSISSVTEKKK